MLCPRVPLSRLFNSAAQLLGCSVVIRKFRSVKCEVRFKTDTMNRIKPAPIVFYKFTCGFFILFSLFSTTHCTQNNSAIAKTFYDLYETGIDSYLDNDFVGCVSNLESALREYHRYAKVINNCRLGCAKEAERASPMHSVDVEHLLFYERAIRNTLCIIKCKTEMLRNNESFSDDQDFERIFQSRKIYEYLHICYFQVGNVQKAASAVFTYLISHRDDKTMLSTLKYYSSFPKVNMKEVVNFEAQEYVYLYSNGVSAYENNKWKETIELMEASLSDYLQAEEECRAQCEGYFDHGWLPDFIPAIANHFTYCLKCKNKCQGKLNSINLEEHDDLLSNHYHYLQFAYFKAGNLKKACRALASYLLLHPKDKTMLSNKKYYATLSEVDESFFTPREEVVRYKNRQDYEKKLLEFIDKEFYFITTMKTEKAKAKVSVIKTSDDLIGVNRFVAEGLLTKNECKILTRINGLFSRKGDGYESISPHTKWERIEGLTIARALRLVYFGLLNGDHLKMMLDVTDRVRQEIIKYFKLQQPLYFTFTHLVCRSPITGSPDNRTDLSHEIHADNCNVIEGGGCEKSPPSYTWRHYSAILYLNDDFEGGEFFFSTSTDTASINSYVVPRCGRMVAFSSGEENLHGVKAVRRGSRCALGLWFTFDRNERETERELARDFLNNINSSPPT